MRTNGQTHGDEAFLFVFVREEFLVSFAHFATLFLLSRAEISIIEKYHIPILIVIAGEVEVCSSSFLFFGLLSYLFWSILRFQYCLRFVDGRRIDILTWKHLSNRGCGIHSLVSHRLGPKRHRLGPLSMRNDPLLHGVLVQMVDRTHKLVRVEWSWVQAVIRWHITDNVVDRSYWVGVWLQ